MAIFKKYLKLTSKLIIGFMIFIIILYIFLYSVNISNLKVRGFELHAENELLCLKSICIKQSGIKECIVMKIPILVKRQSIKDIKYYSGNVYELQFDTISDKCE